MKTENLSTLKIHKLSKEQYEREFAAGRIDKNALYLTPEEEIDSSMYATKEEVNNKAEKDHRHSYNDLNDKPTSLPANGGNADTLDGKHANEFADGNEFKQLKTLVGDTSVSGQISTHNTATDAHNDIRDLINGLSTRLNTLADSDDTTLDQMSEVVAYIKSNKSLIESITTSKVNVSDIIDNLTTNVTNKPLSAAQGVAIKGLIDALQTAVNGKALNSDLTSHTGDTTKHITSTERTNWNNKVGSLTDLGINASATELNYTKGVTNDIQTQINTLSAEINNLKTNVITVHSGDLVPMSSLGSNGDIYMVTGS